MGLTHLSPELLFPLQEDRDKVDDLCMIPVGFMQPSVHPVGCGPGLMASPMRANIIKTKTWNNFTRLGRPLVIGVALLHLVWFGAAFVCHSLCLARLANRASILEICSSNFPSSMFCRPVCWWSNCCFMPWTCWVTWVLTLLLLLLKGVDCGRQVLHIWCQLMHLGFKGNHSAVCFWLHGCILSDKRGLDMLGDVGFNGCHLSGGQAWCSGSILAPWVACATSKIKIRLFPASEVDHNPQVRFLPLR